MSDLLGHWSMSHGCSNEFQNASFSLSFEFPSHVSFIEMLLSLALFSYFSQVTLYTSFGFLKVITVPEF